MTAGTDVVILADHSVLLAIQLNRTIATIQVQ
jgi:hypothetical protein